MLTSARTPRAAFLLAALLSTLATSCQTPQRLLSQEDLLDRQQDFFESYLEELQRMELQGERRIELEYVESIEAPGSEPQSHDVLLLSGGGAFGAFGAGFLEGWGAVTDPEFRRPQFDVVSGISTGALIAPFAFVGTQEAYRTVVDEYRSPGRDWVRKRGIIPYLPGNVSLYDVSKLRAHIRSTITPELILGIAEGAHDGRQLIAGATNIDYGRLRVWDLAQIATKGPPDEAMDRVVSVLTASSAIPGAFPPVEIDGLLYVDGAAAMQVVGGLEDRSWLYLPEGDSLGSHHTGPPIRIRVWIIVNQKLLPDPTVVRARWTSVAFRSLSTLLRTSMLQSIRDAETFVHFINQRPEFDAEMRYVAIPQDFAIPGTEEMFDAETMKALVELGHNMGTDPTSWRTEALRPGAPFPVE
jgi:hypothetical protein